MCIIVKTLTYNCFIGGNICSGTSTDSKGVSFSRRPIHNNLLVNGELECRTDNQGLFSI